MYKTTALPTELCLRFDVSYQSFTISSKIGIIPHMSKEFIKSFISENLSTIEKISNLFREKLPKLEIDIAKYEELAEQDPIFKELFEDVLMMSYQYTIDVSNMEKYAREDKETSREDFTEADKKRSITHDSMILSINIMMRYINKNELDIDTRWFAWNADNRAAYGKFAILLTINLFKEEFILHKVEEIDLENIKKSLNEVEIMILDYVLILSKIHNEDRDPTDEEFKKLDIISIELGKNTEDILSAFYEIYKRRYVNDNK